MKTRALALVGVVWCQSVVAAQGDPVFIQREYAKDPGGKCVKRDRAFYAEKAKTSDGIKELIPMYCQNDVRGNYHMGQSEKVKHKLTPENETQLALDCVREALAILESLRQVGVTHWVCPTK